MYDQIDVRSDLDDTSSVVEMDRESSNHTWTDPLLDSDDEEHKEIEDLTNMIDRNNIIRTSDIVPIMEST